VGAQAAHGVELRVTGADAAHHGLVDLTNGSCQFTHNNDVPGTNDFVMQSRRASGQTFGFWVQ
jgi:hypothetical protein